MMTRQAWINVSGVQWKLQIFFWDLPCYIMRAHANHSASASSSLPSRTKNYYGRGTTMCSPNLLPLPGHTGRWHSQHPLQFGWDHTISGAFILASPHPRPSFFQAIGVGSEMKSNNGGNLGQFGGAAFLPGELPDQDHWSTLHFVWTSHTIILC